MSSRMDQLKQNDPILEYDLIKIFHNNMEELMRNLGL